MTDDQKAAARLPLADQVLANMLGFYLLHWPDGERTALARDVMAEVLPQCGRNNQFTVALANAAGDVLAVDRPNNSSEAQLEAGFVARRAVANFLFWRAGLALEAHRDALNPEKPA